MRPILSGLNRFIAGTQALRSILTEPALLRLFRHRYDRQYQDCFENPLVSIIIATYNRGRILVERTLPSIFAQTYPEWEVVIVGDHCIDDTAEILAKLDHPRVHFTDLPQRGHYPAEAQARWFVQGCIPRNAGLHMARGKWLSWISDDDILLPHHLESLLRFAQQGDFEFVSAVYTAERHGKIHIVDVRDVRPRIGGMQTWLYRSYLKCFRWNVHSWRKSWNRPCDYDLQQRLVRAGVRLGFLEEIVAHVPAVIGTGTVGLEAVLKLEARGGV